MVPIQTVLLPLTLSPMSPGSRRPWTMGRLAQGQGDSLMLVSGRAIPPWEI